MRRPCQYPTIDFDGPAFPNKVSRGRFTAVFLMQCLKALGAEWIHIPPNIDEAIGKSGAQFLARNSDPTQ